MLAAAPAAAQDSQHRAPYPVGDWAKLPAQDRQSTIVAAIEGMLVAATGPLSGAPRVDQDCLSAVSVQAAEATMAKEAARSPRTPFLQAFLEATKCSRS